MEKRITKDFFSAIVVFCVFLAGFYKFASINVLYYYLGSNIKFGFTNSLFACFKTNLKYQLCSLVTILPINALFLTSMYFLIKWLVLSEGLILLAPISIILFAVLLYSFKVTFLSGWIPAIVVFDCGVWEGLCRGVKAVFRRFYHSFSTALFTLFTIIIINVVAAVCTFGASIIVTIPLSALIILVYKVVMFYQSQGMRFYVDSEQVVTPKRLEETDGLGELKYII